MRIYILIIVIIVVTFILTNHIVRNRGNIVTSQHLSEARKFIQENNLNNSICIFINYNLHSGKNRLAVWDLKHDTTIFTCPIAHGRGHSLTIKPQFSNKENSWLSSLGKGVVAERYVGSFGISYRLDGLESSNDNIRKRYIVLHGYFSVPSSPIFPLPSGLSKGCLMVSHKNMKKIDEILLQQKQVLFFSYYNNK